MHLAFQAARGKGEEGVGLVQSSTDQPPLMGRVRSSSSLPPLSPGHTPPHGYRFCPWAVCFLSDEQRGKQDEQFASRLGRFAGVDRDRDQKWADSCDDKTHPPFCFFSP